MSAYDRIFTELRNSTIHSVASRVFHGIDSRSICRPEVMRRGEVSDSAKGETRTNVRAGVVGSESVIMIDHQVDSVVESLPLPRDRQASGIDRIEKCASGIRRAEPRGDTAGRTTVGVESWAGWRRMHCEGWVWVPTGSSLFRNGELVWRQKPSCHGTILCLVLKGEILR